MKYRDINKRYTEIVNEYMGKGYTINTASMSGTQGEVAKIDLTDGNEIIRIIVKTFSDLNEDIGGLEIVIGKAPDAVKPHSNDSWVTIWNSDLEVIYSEQFYHIGKYRRDFYGTKEEAKRAADIRYERYKRRHVESKSFEASPKAMEIAKHIVRSKMGYARINAAEVRLSKTSKGYCVKYRNNYYTLH